MVQTHELKTVEQYFDAVARGDKTFEVRKNDRAFQTGDVLILAKVDSCGRYITKTTFGFDKITLKRRISYILQGGQFGIEAQYCVLGLAEISKD